MEFWQGLLDSAEFLVVAMLLAIGYFRGRHNERQHLLALAERERLLADVMVFATRNPPPFTTPHDPLLVCGEVALSADYFRMFVAGLRKFVGGRFHGFETLVARARREAVLRMKEQARAAGCTLIIHVRVETTSIAQGPRGGSSVVEAIAYGTALLPASGAIAQSRLHVQASELEVLAGSTEPFDLAKNRASRRVIAVWFVGIAWLFAEMLGLGRYDYAGGTPWAIFAMLAGLAAIPLWRVLRRWRAPATESVMLTLLSGGLACVLMSFLALHINGWTDFSPRTETAYRYETDGSLRPAGCAECPTLSFPRYYEYFQAKPRDERHAFTLRRGVLGFWQFDRDAFQAKLKAFYHSR
ncbi:MAG: heavy metal-binding domain-containing protein [Gammaproteobacteria bacterium]|nr:heavy metal-binding domain-containing protein [Gammaproteobacteria bacterium]